MRSSIVRNNGVRRPCRTVNPSTCSANVLTAQAVPSQNHRRTRSLSTNFRPPTGESAK
ncbi:hypothetical protein ABZX92_41575 [Lentzea sp. NPDC006480]|uniref:hypothetical protein n=1 Tax=Lentzea sp. NPDC006480 TaxID=3157176 RepID=UPI0033AC7987